MQSMRLVDAAALPLLPVPRCVNVQQGIVKHNVTASVEAQAPSKVHGTSWHQMASPSGPSLARLPSADTNAHAWAGALARAAYGGSAMTAVSCTIESREQRTTCL